MTHLETAPHPLQGNSLLGGFLTPLTIFFSVFNDSRTEAWRAAVAEAVADRSHVAAGHGLRLGLNGWRGGLGAQAEHSGGGDSSGRRGLRAGVLARWGAPGKAGAGRARRRRGQGRRGRRGAARGEPALQLALPRPGPPTRGSGAEARRTRAVPRCLHFSGRRRGWG